jgi:carbamoyl-phosphate synthase small subunit
MSKSNQINPAILLLADGKSFEGFSTGIPATATGEICFNTGMTGYQEIFTDPSYFGQIVITTHVHIGNYGVSHAEAESESIKIAGLVCKDLSSLFSRKMANGDIVSYFAENGIPAIFGIDTREVVRYIRNKGVMNAIISSETTDIEELSNMLKSVPSMEGLELASVVSTKEAYQRGSVDASFRVALLDLGVKKSIVDCLVQRDCLVKVFPARTSFGEMMEFEPDGFMLSNGPGDPATLNYAVETTKQILASGIPMFGICLGHQVFAKAMGVSTFKMFNGHRGINHPVKNLLTGLSEITSQNHGFAVVRSEVESHPDLQVTHIHLNDNTIAGIRHTSANAFSVQYHPEASPGPHDSRYLFDQFIEMISSVKQSVTNN